MKLNEALVTKKIFDLFLLLENSIHLFIKTFSKVSTSKDKNKFSRIILNPLFPDLHFFNVMPLNAFMIRDDIIYPQLPYFESI